MIAITPQDMLLKAETYAAHYHRMQKRKVTGLPYIIHPRNVVKNLTKYGIYDEKTLSIGWLHDTLEDTTLSYYEILQQFGVEVAEGVRILTRDVSNDEYKIRLIKADRSLMMIKLCDTLDNIITLNHLSKEGIEKKINDCHEFYIPAARIICPQLAKDMQYYIDYWTKERKEYI